MRLTNLFSKTSKTSPSDETSRNARLLIQAGYIHKEMAGVYDYLPLGKIVIDKIANIVREEMNAIGGQEIGMSALQGKELWEKSGRWDDKVVDAWFKSKLANGSEVGLGWSHEEPITNMLISYIQSYKDLPVYVYQIQTKFRNELRAKSGLMRGRELLMKDMYSFSKDKDEHEKFYETATNAYLKVYKRLGVGDITYKTFASGGIFTKYSHEFQTLSEVGEDTIYVDKAKKLGINKEVFNDEVLAHLGVNKEHLKKERAVEVGNIFTLGSRYSDALGLRYTDKDGASRQILMGCYGIGISRLMGLLAEHFADDKGLVWPINIAPAIIIIARLGEENETTKLADEMYNHLTMMGVSVIYDDRDVRAGQKLTDSELLGIPYTVVVSEKTVKNKKFEVRNRKNSDTKNMSKDELLKMVASLTTN
ncbi:MAG TPA: aminoacyl--tRNA ligase-related protein [Candidatus Saccharimonadales bacterium]|nr:aminoacyl--tRNA ligase-related protein [Candidatus Saccharimonadales bacterium]